MRKASLTGLTTGTFDEVLVRNPPFSGSLVSVTSLGSGGGSSYDDTEVRSLISQNAAGLALKASTSALTTGLAGKQDTIADGDLSIAKTGLLQSTLDGKATTADLTSGLAGKQASIQDGDLSIAKTALLQTTLDGKATTAALTTGLAGKQSTIQDGDLSIAKTALLQSTLDSKATTSALTTGLAGKQATIQDGDLSIAKTSGLQSALDDKATTSALTTGLAGKQATIQDGGLSIAKTSGLQAALDAKATTSALTTGLAGKQNTLQAGSLSIAITHGLQTALDDKQDSLGVNSSGSTYLPLDKLTLPNSTVAVGSVSGQVVVTSTPHHSEVTGLATELAAKAPQASTYSKTEVDNIAAAKANQGDLLSIYDGSSFAQITQLTVNNANTTLSGTSAFVTPDALEVRAGGSAAYLACRNLEFMNHTVTAQSSATPHSVQVTSNVAVKGSSGGFVDTTKLHFPDGQLEIGLGANAGELGVRMTGLKEHIGSAIGGGGYASVSGTWTSDTTSTAYTSPLRFGTTGIAYPPGSGPDVDTSGANIRYTIPTGDVRGGSIWLTHLLDQTGGYFDVFLRDADTNQSIFYGRHNSYRSGSAAASGTESAGQRLICIASNYSSAFDQVVIKAMKGRVYVIAVAFSEAWHPVATTDWVHQDNVISLSAALDEKQPLTKWSINATLSSGGWYSVGAMYAVSTGQLTIRSDHNIVTAQLGRVYNSLNGQKQFEVIYAGSASSFTSIRIKSHPTSIYSWYIVQVYVNPSYLSSAKSFSALWDDTCPKDQGTSSSTMSIEPVDFVPDADSITTPNVGNVSSWSVGYTLAI